MNDEPLVRSVEDGRPTAPAPTSPVDVTPVSSGEGEVIHAARLVVGLLGLLLVLVLPIGALVSDRGIMTSDPKPTYQQVPSRPVQTAAPATGGNSGNDPVQVKDRATSPVGLETVQDVPSQPTKKSPSVTDASRMSALVLGVSQTVRDYATNCRRNRGIILSGSGGDRICSASDYTLTWPVIAVCGSSPSDTKWTVFRGDTDTWDITITCAERPGCDGPSNALCTTSGCTFSETCLPK